ncbi:MAG: S41 family peptidase [Chloroflexota bacterium]|nr:S41 family peptidase [Chloroflexota bacterium]
MSQTDHLSSEIDVAPSPWHEDTGSPRGRTHVYLAAFLVVILGGAGLFVSGFMLGRLQQMTPGTSESRQELFTPFWDAYNDITRNYVGEFDERLLVQGAIKGLFDALGDRFSSYMTEEEYRNSLISLSGEFEGIGAELGLRDPEGNGCSPISATCRLVVLRVIRGSPALVAGLLPGDAILSVDGEPTLGKTIDEVIPTIRGKKGTTVRLGLDRNGEGLELSIVRDVIQKEDVTSELLADGRIGYVKINSFSAGVAADLQTHLRELVARPELEGVILDLRDDPGGYVAAARSVASQFVSSSPLYWEQNARAEPIPQDPEEGGVASDPSLPVVVLVNGGTASASEIVAGALQGHGRALLVGQQTYGKGTIQEWKELAGAGGYRLSVRKWLLPDKSWIHDVGLTPDVVVDVPAEVPEGTDPIRDRAVELLLDGARPSPAPSGQLLALAA